MPRSFVVLEYEDSSNKVYAYRLAGEDLERVRLTFLTRLAHVRPVSWQGTGVLPVEGREVVLLEGIRGALEILHRADEGQARVDDEIRGVTKLSPALQESYHRQGGVAGGTLVPEASEDPEACDRGCVPPGASDADRYARNEDDSLPL